jgi:hypothetical protein
MKIYEAASRGRPLSRPLAARKDAFLNFWFFVHVMGLITAGPHVGYEKSAARSWADEALGICIAIPTRFILPNS